jgi:ferritin-like metal-binding protein YciE
MENTQERLIRYLDDAWAVEKGLVSSLQDMANEVNDPKIKMMFEQHRQVTHQQEEALEARIRALGEEPSGSKGFFTQFMGKMGDFMHKAKDEYDQTTQDLMKAYATENFECAMYESLEAYATAIGDSATAALARAHHQQEKQAAEMVWSMVQSAAIRPAQIAGITNQNIAA